MFYPPFVFLSEGNSNSKVNFHLFLVSIILWFYFSYTGAFFFFFLFLFHGILFCWCCLHYLFYLFGDRVALSGPEPLSVLLPWAPGCWVCREWASMTGFLCLNGTIFSQESLNMKFSISIFNHFWLVYSLALYCSLFFLFTFYLFLPHWSFQRQLLILARYSFLKMRPWCDKRECVDWQLLL